MLVQLSSVRSLSVDQFNRLIGITRMQAAVAANDYHPTEINDLRTEQATTLGDLAVGSIHGDLLQNGANEAGK